jgi:hypothetical protein
MGAVTHGNLDDVFSYHAPKGDFQIEKYHRMRQAAKVCAKAILDDQDKDTRIAALRVFWAHIERECGDCRDRSEARGMLLAGEGFAGGMALILSRNTDGAEFDALAAEMEGTQAVISCIRGALMWANASVALEGRV